MKRLYLNLTDGGGEPVIDVSIDDPMLAVFVSAGFIIALLVLIGLGIIGFRFLCMVGVCNAFRSC